MFSKIIDFFNKIRVRLIAFNTLLIIVPVLILGYYGYQHLTEQIQSDTSKLITANLKNISLNANNILSNIETIAFQKSKDQKFFNNIESFLNSEAQEDREVNLSKLSIDIVQSSLENRFIDSVYLLCNNNKVIITSEIGYKLLHYNNGECAPYQQINTIGWHLVASLEDSNEKIISYYRPIENKYGLLYNINVNDFDIIINRENMVENGIQLFILDRNDSLLYNTHNGNRFDIIEYKNELQNIEGNSIIELEEENYILTYITDLQNGWKYIAIISVEQVYKGAYYIKEIIIILYCLSFAAALLGAFVFSISISKPIETLIMHMRKVEKGDLSIVEKYNNKNEFGTIFKSFNKMVEKLKQLINDVYKQKLLRREAQLKSVLSQINEHFLYNTINSIKCVAKSYQAEKVCEMLDVLSKYFRINLSQGKEVVEVSEIMTIIKYYLYLQKLRFGDNLKIKIEYDDKLDKYYVLKYLFQPLVENAINYGIQKKGNGEIKIRLYKRGDLLLFSVKDDGIGISMKVLDEIVSNKTGHYALNNISEQIKLFYGEKYCVKIVSILNKGTIVYFMVPLIKDTGINRLTRTDGMADET